MILTTAAVALAYRGKGGLFAQWGVKGGIWQHLLGAVIVGAVLAVNAPLWFPVFVALWFLYTRPTPHYLFTTLERAARSERVTLKEWLLCAYRQAYILPICAAVYISGSGTLWALCGFLPLLLIYYIGGVTQKISGADGVVVAEYLTAIAGIMLYWLGA